MTPPPMPEAERQRALDAYRILDTLPESAFDDLVRVAAAICDVPNAALTLIDRGRQWLKAGVGIEMVETPREHAFCDHAIRAPGELLEVGDASVDPRFAGNPLVTAEAGLRFYAGAPLVTPSGAAIGALCVTHDTPHRLDARQREALSSLARIAMNMLEVRHRLREVERDHVLEAAAHPPALPPQPYALAIVEVQGHAALVQHRGERMTERLLAALDDALSALMRAERGDSVSRATGSAETIAVVHGDDAQDTLGRMATAARAFARGHGVEVRIGTAHAATPQESAHDVFLRADAALSADKDRTPDDP